MKTIRLLFNDDMARAIVEGRKTVTRRPAMGFHGCAVNPALDLGGVAASTGIAFFDMFGRTHEYARLPCAPGDLLIGRECWGSGDLYYHDHETEPPGVIVYRADRSGRYADDTPLPKRDTDSFNWSMQKWRPSIHMPDWAARIRRRVIAVTVERLQDISEADAVREGFPAGRHGGTNARHEFACAWDDIYLNRGLGSAVNPWVWRIEFTRENVEGEQ